MSSTLNGYGLRPVTTNGGYAAAQEFPNGIASGYASNILQYQPVTLVGNTIVAATTTSQDILGVFMGVQWIDGNGNPQLDNKWVAGTVYGTAGGAVTLGYGCKVLVLVNPNVEYEIQANGSIAANGYGKEINFLAASLASGSTQFGLSQTVADASSITNSGQGQLRIIGLAPTQGNAWGDAFTNLRVQIARHQYVSNKVAV